VDSIPVPKILMLANHFVAHGGGLERMAHDLAIYLQEIAGYEVTLAAHGAPPGDTPYHCLAIRSSGMAERLTGLPLLMPHPGDFGPIAAAVRASDAVVLHDNLYVSHLYVQRVAHKAGIPVLVIKHTGWVQGGSRASDTVQSLANWLWFGPSLRRADQVVAVTEAKRANLARNLRDVRIEVIENGIDTDFFTPAETTRDIDLLFIGRFVEKKGIGLIAKLARRFPELRFTCAGFGPHSPAQWRLPNVAVIVRPGAEEIRDTYRRSRLTLVPCLSEGTPLVVPESLACGTPVLASEQAAHRALPVGKPLPIDLDWPATVLDHWARSIRDRLKEPLEPYSLHRAVEANFSLTAMGRGYAEQIERLVAAPTT
jgi:glycosyltransferase involved in cell wall biosynthesis